MRANSTNAHLCSHSDEFIDVVLLAPLYLSGCRLQIIFRIWKTNNQRNKRIYFMYSAHSLDTCQTVFPFHFRKRDAVITPNIYDIRYLIIDPIASFRCSAISSVQSACQNWPAWCAFRLCFNTELPRFGKMERNRNECHLPQKNSAAPTSRSCSRSIVF